MVAGARWRRRGLGTEDSEALRTAVILYGDKVINIVNQRRQDVLPEARRRGIYRQR